MDALDPLISALHTEGRLRVWSLVITVFGDMVQQRGGRISTARLGPLLGRVGVEPGAMRTALSRLGNDGWVESERKGRTSIYRLSTQGIHRFGPATERIYAPPRSTPVTRWAMAVKLGDGSAEPRLLPADEAPADSDCMVVGEISTLSDAYRQSLLSAPYRDALTALASDLDALAQIEPDDALTAAAARMLLIHRWRRIVLRFPELPAELMPDNAPLTRPRNAVANAYRRFWAASERWLDSEIGGQSGMPAANGLQQNRFGMGLRG